MLYRFDKNFRDSQTMIVLVRTNFLSYEYSYQLLIY